ncbi:RhuM family protein, partial [Mogibacterium sp.]|uniref:RhuM family protein n=1 Tax=Mogibacterium sp. TaxID=2049035 RepID=UPI0025F3F98D
NYESFMPFLQSTLLLGAYDGKTYNTNHYSLEMIIAVGFKVNSERAVQFRKWVNQIMKDYIIKGWVMDDERLKLQNFMPKPNLKSTV